MVHVNNEIATPAARTSGDAGIAHAHHEASVKDTKGLKEHQESVHNSPGETNSRQAAQDVVTQQIDGKNPLQIVDHSAGEHPEAAVNHKVAGQADETKDQKKDDPQSDEKSGAGAEHAGKHGSEGGGKAGDAGAGGGGGGGGGGGDSKSLEDDPATLTRRHHMEAAQALGLPPDASDAEIANCLRALQKGLGPTASLSEIDQEQQAH